MKRIKKLFKGITAVALALLLGIGGVNIGAGITEVSAAGVNNEPTIRMGDNAPMNRAEFLAWSSQRNIRHFRIDGRIYPAGIFFNGHGGQSFSYGELSESILNVYLRPGVASSDRVPSTQEAPVVDIPAVETPTLSDPITAQPVIFNDMTPIFFTDEELTLMIESVPHQGPLDTRSAITLPNRRLTETELEAWIYEYNEMGGPTAFDLGVVREVNRVRERYGLSPLYLCPALMLSARLKTQEFGDLQYFGHHSPVHGSPSVSARMFGFDGAAGEAITRSGGNGAVIFDVTPEGVVGGMLASTRGHRQLLLNPNIDRVGFGSFFSPYSRGISGNMTHMFYYATKFGFIIN